MIQNKAKVGKIIQASGHGLLDSTIHTDYCSRSYNILLQENQGRMRPFDFDDGR